MNGQIILLLFPICLYGLTRRPLPSLIISIKALGLLLLNNSFYHSFGCCPPFLLALQLFKKYSFNFFFIHQQRRHPVCYYPDPSIYCLNLAPSCLLIVARYYFPPLNTSFLFAPFSILTLILLLQSYFQYYLLVSLLPFASELLCYFMLDVLIFFYLELGSFANWVPFHSTKRLLQI